ncbi:MAG: trimeric intracellular cation channel family protein [Gemmatimonadetes bacterium]|nr:trimeric intracellular cation channel family protein [Gemmatimonadota bacterium]
MLRYVIDLVGIAVFAISGALAAGRKSLDVLGVLVLATVTAVGGGTIRDLLLGRLPIFWLTDPSYLLVILVSALATVGWARRWRVPEMALQVADALGLALFSVARAQIAMGRGLPVASCVLLGTVTGAAGGMVRDILSAEVPLVLRKGNLYASAAIAGTLLYAGLERAGVADPLPAFAGVALIAALRLVAIWRGLTLPVFSVGP